MVTPEVGIQAEQHRPLHERVFSAVQEHVLGHAYTDELTGLPNRRWFNRELAGQVERTPGNFALVSIDLDEFKTVNDTKGHAAGDQLLKTTAAILTDSIRTSTDFGRQPDQVSRFRQRRFFGKSRLGVGRFSRWGGDEFPGILAGVSTQEQVDIVIERIKQNLAAANIPASVAGRPHRSGESGDELFHDVDTLVYRQKALHKQQRLEALPRRKRVAHRLSKLLGDYAGAGGRR